MKATLLALVVGLLLLQGVVAFSIVPEEMTVGGPFYIILNTSDQFAGTFLLEGPGLNSQYPANQPVITIKPRTPGVYTATLNNPIGQKQLQARVTVQPGFEVNPVAGNPLISVDKEVYELGEIVKISLAAEASTAWQVTITNGNRRFDLLEQQSIVTFIPQSTGLYIVEAQSTPGNHSTLLSQFYVRDSTSIEELRVRHKTSTDRILKARVLDRDTMTGRGTLVSTESVGSIVGMRLSGYLLSQQGAIGIDEVAAGKHSINRERTSKLIVVDPTNLDFHNGTLETIARGTSLWKCKSWDSITEQCIDSWQFIQKIVPGTVYAITIDPADPAFAETGVATINSIRPIYRPGEVAELLAAVLDTQGYLVGKARVNITVTTPSGSSTKYQTVENTVTETSHGIYRTNFTTSREEGTYGIVVDAMGPGVSTTLGSSFDVAQEFPYDIKRNVPMSIDPWQGPTTISLTIEQLAFAATTERFTVYETVPINATIVHSGGATVSRINNTWQLRWTNVKSNETLTYQVQFPLRTPDLYAVGPVTIVDDVTSTEEARPWYIAIDPILSSNAAIDIDMTAMDNETIVVAYIDRQGATATSHISFKVLQTNGTELVGETDIETTGNLNSRVSVEAINLTTFAIAFINNGPTLKYAVYNRDGSNKIPATQIVLNTGTNTDISLTTIDDRSALCLANDVNDDAELYFVNSTNAALIGSLIQVDNNMATLLPRQNLIECSSVNRTHVEVAWFDRFSSDAMIRTYNKAGTSVSGATAIDTGAGTYAQVAVAGLRNMSFAFLYFDALTADQDVSYTIRNATTTATGTVIDADLVAGNESRVAVAEIESNGLSKFVIAWFDKAGYNLSAQVLWQNGSVATNTFLITHNYTRDDTHRLIDVVGTRSSLGFGLCSDTFAIGYVNSSNITVVDTFWSNGSKWNGVCPDGDPPRVTLNEPLNNTDVRALAIAFNFTPVDNRDTSLANCTLWGNFSSSAFAQNSTTISVPNGTKSNITISLTENRYTWNVLCEDQSRNRAFAVQNYTMYVNAYPPNITNPRLNASLINQSERVAFNVSLADRWGVSRGYLTVTYPNGTQRNFTLAATSNGYTINFSDTTQLGTHNISLVVANDTFNFINQNTTLNLNFTVQASPPAPFNLLTPVNKTETQNLQPNLTWQPSSDTHFRNYTIWMDQDSGFGSPDYTYSTDRASNTSFLVTFALDVNTVYYWRVIAFDNFSNSRNSTDDFVYITDTIAPVVTLLTPPNNTISSASSIQFNYSVTDTNTINTCALFGNFSGPFIVNESQLSPPKDTINNVTINLTTDGQFVWNIRCNDTASNRQFALQNFTFVNDLTPPTIRLLYPANNSVQLDTNNMVFSINATDTWSNITTCKLVINNITRQTVFDVQNNIAYNFTEFVQNGNYSWYANCTDTWGQVGRSGLNNLTMNVTDTNAPLILLNSPSPAAFFATTNLTVNYTPQDSTGLTNCSLWIDDIWNQTDTDVENLIPHNFTIINSTEELHNWSIRCYDNGTGLNYGISDTRNFTIDLTDPTITLVAPLGTSQSTSDVTFTYIPVDINLDTCILYGNWSGTFTADLINDTVSSGLETTLNKTLPDGNFLWNIYCNDSAGRFNFSSPNQTIFMDTTRPYWYQNTSSPLPPIIYDPLVIIELNVTWNDTNTIANVTFEGNFSGEYTNISLPSKGIAVYNYSVTSLAAGSYFYRWHANDSLGNSNSTPWFRYTIDRTASAIRLYLNSTQGNFSMPEETFVNLTAVLLVPASGDVEIYLNGTRIANGSSPLQNITNMTKPGIYNITAIYWGSQNYSYSNTTYFLQVNDTTSPYVELRSPANLSGVATQTVNFQYNVSDETSVKNCSLYIKGIFEVNRTDIDIDVVNTLTVTKPNGNYTWYVQCEDTSGNIGTSGVFNLTILESYDIGVTVAATPNATVQRGDVTWIESNSTDAFGTALVTNITTDVIYGRTTHPWWNISYPKRRPIFLNNSYAVERIETVDVNVTGLAGTLVNCRNDTRIIRSTGAISEVIPFQVLANTSSLCSLRFTANISANALNENAYDFYYGKNATDDSTTVSLQRLYVQRGGVTGTTATLSSTIATVDASKTFVLFTVSSGDSGPDIWQFTSQQTDTSVSFNRYGTGTASTISWETVTSPDITVQQSDVAFAAGTSEVNVTIAPVNQSQSFIIISGRVNTGTTGNNPQGFFRGHFYNGSIITIERLSTGTAAIANYQVVEWEGTRVQGGNQTLALVSARTTINTTNFSRSFVVVSRSQTGDTGVDANYVSANLTNATEILFTRVTGGSTMHVDWFAVELPAYYLVQRGTTTVAASGSGTLNPVVDLSRSFSALSWQNTQGNTFYSNTHMLSNISSPSSITFTKASGTSSNIIEWQVIEEESSSSAVGENLTFVFRKRNETSIQGITYSNFSTKGQRLGNYSAVSVANRALFYDSVGTGYFEIIRDLTPPTVLLSAPNDTFQMGVGMMNFSYTPHDPNLNNCTFIYGLNGERYVSSNITNTTPESDINNTFYFVNVTIGLYQWNVNCTDEEGNSGIATLNRTLNVTGSDLRVRTQDIWFSNTTPKEYQNVTVYANITNVGLTDALQNFTVQFYRGFPSTGEFLKNYTIPNLTINEIVTVNISFFTNIGINTIFVRIDPDGRINESDESNNNASTNVTTPLYQYYYGNATHEIIIDAIFNQSLVRYTDESAEGNIYIADSDSIFSFIDLQALGRNKNGIAVANDFSDADTSLNGTLLNDSINTIWAGGTNSPLVTQSFNISGATLANVPVANSTNSSTFVTGILWDTTDDASINLQYDATDREDLVFVTRVVQNQIGSYGSYDYEMRVPSSLKDYKGSTASVIIYVELQ